MPRGVFISYRRSDVPHAAVLLHMLLSRRLPLEEIFIDVSGIEPGDDFVRSLADQLASCKVLLAVIGPGWLQAKDAARQRRLEDPNDYVRIEIETALARNVHIVPVLIGDTHVPSSDELPPSLAPLARLNIIRPTLDPSGHGIESLASKIEKTVHPDAMALSTRRASTTLAPGVGPYAPKRGAILEAARSLVQGSRLPSRITRILLPDLFLKQDPSDAISQYRDEPLVTPGLPYVEIIHWCREFVAGRQPTIEVRVRPGRFELSSWGPGDGDLIREAGFGAFRTHKPKTFDGPAVRVDGYRIAGSRLFLQAQHATYFAQVRSNLILDYRHRLPNGATLSLRNLFRQEFGHRLPPLGDTRLANTLGVSALIFCRSGDELTPYLLVRTREVAVNDLGNEWHCTASGVAELRGEDGGAANFIEWSMRKELEEEVGLIGDDLDALAPIAFCRELLRAGKPQFFFLGITSLSLAEITKRLKGARRRAKQVGDIVENTALPLLRSPASLMVPDATALQGRTISTEAAACLHYFFSCLKGDDLRG